MGRTAWFLALAITVGFMLADYLPGKASSLYVEVLGPLLASCWLAMAFRRWWLSRRASLLGASSIRLGLLLFVAAMVLLLGGIRLLWVEPWLFAPMLWPLFEVAKALREKLAASRARLTIGH